MNDSFLSKSIISVMGAVLLSAINLFIGILLARWLGPNALGRYQIIISSGIIVASFCSLGLGGASVYFINNKKIERKIVSTIAFKFSWLSGVFVFCLLLIIFSGKWYFGTISFTTKIFAAINSSLLLILAVNNHIFIAQEKIIIYQLITLAPRIVLILALLTGSFFYSINYENSIQITALGQFAGFLFLCYFLRHELDIYLKTDTHLMCQMIKFGFFMSLAYFVVMLNKEAMNLILNLFLNNNFSEIGYFSRAYRTGVLLLTFSSAIKPLLFSRLSRLNDEQRVKKMERVLRIWLVIIALPCIITWHQADFIIVLLYGGEFLPSVAIFRVTLVGSFFYSFLMYQIGFFSASGKPLITVKIMAINLLLLCLLGAVAVPSYQGVGMGYAYVFATLISLYISTKICIKDFGMVFQKALIVEKDDFKYILENIPSRHSINKNS